MCMSDMNEPQKKKKRTGTNETSFFDPIWSHHIPTTLNKWDTNWRLHKLYQETPGRFQKPSGVSLYAHRPVRLKLSANPSEHLSYQGKVRQHGKNIMSKHTDKQDQSKSKAVKVKTKI